MRNELPHSCKGGGGGGSTRHAPIRRRMVSYDSKGIMNRRSGNIQSPTENLTVVK